ncbi:MAG: OmpA family protein [Hyphomicrobium sp.]
MRCNPSYWLLGLIPVAMLSWLAVQVEHEGIEADLGRRAADALQRIGLPWAVPTFSGRDGVVSGKATDDTDPARALAAVRDTWGVRVTHGKTELIEYLEKYLWSAVVRDGKVVLGGFVPTEDVRQAIGTAARAQFPKFGVIDEMKLARGAPDRDIWLGAITFGMKQLAQLKRGAVELEGTSLSIEGEAATTPAYRSVKSALAGGLPRGSKLASEKIVPPVASPFVWSAKWSASDLATSGFAPDEATLAALQREAKGRYAKARISDRTEIAGGAPDGFDKAALSALAQLSALKSGAVDIKNKDVSFIGEAADEATAQAVRKALRLGVPQAFKLTEQIKYPKAAVAEGPGNYIMTISSDGTAIEVGGFVPSEAARAALVDAVKARFPGRAVTDKLQIATGAPEGWQQCIVAGLAALPRLKSGRTLLNDRKLLVSGTTDDYGVAQGVPIDLKAAAGQTCETATDIAFTGEINANLTWVANRSRDGGVVLDGDIPDESVRPVLLAAAERLFPRSRPVDQMSVRAAPIEPWNVMALRALEQLARLERGEAAIAGQQLTVTGIAADEQTAADVRQRITRDLPKGFAARDDITVARRMEAISEATKCEALLRETAASGTIQFSRAKANLTAESARTLYELAEVANACPSFRIEIAGHTDSEGTDERNQRLSNRRAQSVVGFLTRAGVDKNRLTAVGYGATRPVADNASEDGRAQNRRIEFIVKSN